MSEARFLPSAYTSPFAVIGSHTSFVPPALALGVSDFARHHLPVEFVARNPHDAALPLSSHSWPYVDGKEVTDTSTISTDSTVSFFILSISNLKSLSSLN